MGAQVQVAIAMGRVMAESNPGMPPRWAYQIQDMTVEQSQLNMPLYDFFGLSQG